MGIGGNMQLIKMAVHRAWGTSFFVVALLSFVCPRPAAALEEMLVSYAGPSVTFLPAEVARQRGFFRGGSGLACAGRLAGHDAAILGPGRST
jgi:hypothetical protein